MWKIREKSTKSEIPIYKKRKRDTNACDFESMRAAYKITRLPHKSDALLPGITREVNSFEDETL